MCSVRGLVNPLKTCPVPAGIQGEGPENCFLVVRVPRAEWVMEEEQRDAYWKVCWY